MSVYSVPVTIGVDEKRIAEEIQNDVEHQVVKTITKEVKNKMFSKNNYYQEDPINTMIKNEVKRIVEDNKDYIVENASKLLCEKLSRTKTVREAVQDVIDKI